LCRKGELPEAERTRVSKSSLPKEGEKRLIHQRKFKKGLGGGARPGSAVLPKKSYSDAVLRKRCDGENRLKKTTAGEKKVIPSKKKKS